ncbi:MAG: GNAT family N-acetyltransferase [Myxococcota bacterium]
MDLDQERADVVAELDPIEGPTRLVPVADDPVAHQRWCDRDLASLVEGSLGVVTDPLALDAPTRDRITARLPDHLRPSRAERPFGTRLWIVDDSEEVGTLGIWPTIGRLLVPLASLYVDRPARGRGAASRALGVAQRAAELAGFDGIRLETEWTWHLPARMYLRRGFWVLNWKHSLAFHRSARLPAIELRVGDDEAACLLEGAEVVRAHRLGDRLGWARASVPEALERHRFHAEATFALALALDGWPLVRSDEEWAKSRLEFDVGGPECLARYIRAWEAHACRHGLLNRAPAIPGVPG